MNRQAAVPEISVDPVLAAREAGLRHVCDREPGISRRKKGRRFEYRNADGRRVKDEAALRRIASLAIPPAWTDVWICPRSNGHLQATGRDARGRKQYRYHPDWRRVRDETKYDRMIAFGRALPAIRRRVARDLRQRGLTREKVLATVVRLLETTLIRVGNDEYARDNDSYGLTTLRDRHVKSCGAGMRFEFRAKSGKLRSVDIGDPRLRKIIRQCRDLPGWELFQYIDDDGLRRDVGSADVNAYLREISGDDFTAKDFRTWAGTVLAARALREFEAFNTHAEAKKNLVTAIEAVAKMLGNTPAICRKCYVHPVIMDTYLDGALIAHLQGVAKRKLASDLRQLRPEEAAVLMLLEQQLKQGCRSGRKR